MNLRHSVLIEILITEAVLGNWRCNSFEELITAYALDDSRFTEVGLVRSRTNGIEYQGLFAEYGLARFLECSAGTARWMLYGTFTKASFETLVEALSYFRAHNLRAEGMAPAKGTISQKAWYEGYPRDGCRLKECPRAQHEGTPAGS